MPNPTQTPHKLTFWNTAHPIRGSVLILLLALSVVLGACRSIPGPLGGAAPGTVTGSPGAAENHQGPGLTDTPFPPADTPTPRTPTATPSPSPTPDPYSIPQDLTYYDIDVIFNYNRHTLQAAETILFMNNTGETQETVTLVVDPNKQPGIFTLNAVTLAGGIPAEDYKLEKHLLEISLEGPLSPGDGVVIGLDFSLNLPERPSALGYTEFQTNLIDWFPFIPPYRPGEGWLINKPWPYGEYLVYDSADFTVSIRLEGETPGLTVVAGAPADIEGDKLVYQLEGARSFAWAASPYYEISTDEVSGVTLTSYYYSSHQDAGEAALETAARALELYEDLFGPYPHDNLNVVEASFPDGKEFDGLVFISQGYYAEYDGTVQNFLTILAIHETAHQWWFGLVGNDQANEPWLDEALSTYSELLYYERYHPELPDWWWFYRVNYFNPQGWINGTIYEYARFDPYFNAVYHRGAQFIQSLREALGDESFFSFLKQYAVQNRFGQSTEASFFELLSNFTDQEIETLKTFYFEPGDE